MSVPVDCIKNSVPYVSLALVAAMLFACASAESSVWEHAYDEPLENTHTGGSIYSGSYR